jgi:hypothetical protein
VFWTRFTLQGATFAVFMPGMLFYYVNDSPMKGLARRPA